MQEPSPGGKITCCCGDLITITLVGPSTPPKGKAWLRTNLGSAHIRRAEIVAHVEGNEPILSGDWHDFPMQERTVPAHPLSCCFQIAVPCFEPGVFEAKAFFLPDGASHPVWPQGENLQIKIAPAPTFAQNTIYTAFVRQFGPSKAKQTKCPLPKETLASLDASDWSLIPKSGTFRNLIKELDHIIDNLGFRIIQLLPIHPVPTTFARMGRFGSPFASIDFFNVDPALAEFDRRSTPLQQFEELVEAIHQRNACIFLDLPINHTGWASQLQVHHPEWFGRNDDNSFASPGAWGIVWEDLSELNYEHRALWQYMADVFLFWCQQGVDGFRCDAGYMVPLPVWEYIVAKVRTQFPETIFLLEGLGGHIEVTESLLSKAGLDWAYSEIFQVYDRAGLEHQLQHDHASAKSHGPLVHFAETHDNNRLAATSPVFARMRTALAALTSDAGAFGITNGVEWFATAKVDVHGAPTMDWGASENQTEWIRSINHILRWHPAFYHGAEINLLPSGNAVLQVLRKAPGGNHPVLVLVNTDADHQAKAQWPTAAFPCKPAEQCTDLLTRQTLQPDQRDGHLAIQLSEGEVRCLSTEAFPEMQQNDPITIQQTKALAMALCAHLQYAACESHAPEELAKELRADPAAFCVRISQKTEAQILTRWQAPEDLRRTVMLPSEHMLLIQAPHPFRITITASSQYSVSIRSIPQRENAFHFAIYIPQPDREKTTSCNLQMVQYDPQGVQYRRGIIQTLPHNTSQKVQLQYDREDLRGSRLSAILTNGCGAMSQVRLEWGHIESQYDALLAANLHPSVPVDRHVLFTRCRIWLVHKGYSSEINLDCIRNVQIIPGQMVIWRFDVPAGMGRVVPLHISLSWQQGQNAVFLQFEREGMEDKHRQLANDAAIDLIIRPDIEDRNCHCATKAYAGPEDHLPASIHQRLNGFVFDPGPHAQLHMQMPASTYTHEPEWQYAIPHPFEADRGLEPNGDLFSPGYFTISVKGGESHCLSAWVPAAENISAPHPPDCPPPPAPEADVEDVLYHAIKDFIVRRDDARTVIAGYPWFLDWGRDTLICLRGMIAADLVEESCDILKQFARFEKNGTIPNMIRGMDDRDRDTSDAPLWLFTACRDVIQHTGNHDILEMDCDGRTLMDVLQSLAKHYIAGTPNGIRMDKDSALVYSPSHFTWMDTNYPAGTPRQGYPIEIQALWFAALDFLADVDQSNTQWRELAGKVQESILQLYRTDKTNGALSDCLHCEPGTPASKATADNAIRPNQLFAITLQAVTNPSTIASILRETACLLVPGAIRSLADQPITPLLAIHGEQGLLNNPAKPYQGQYKGDEDTQRKPAYHNGTAWNWPFPSYCEALAMRNPDNYTQIATELIQSVVPLLESGCIAHLPEIMDGDHPHAQRGCWAQAWSATEAYRVLTLLKNEG